jgi:hypothetical protein
MCTDIGLSTKFVKVGQRLMTLPVAFSIISKPRNKNRPECSSSLYSSTIGLRIDVKTTTARFVEVFTMVTVILLSPHRKHFNVVPHLFERLICQYQKIYYAYKLSFVALAGGSACHLSATTCSYDYFVQL